MNCEHCGHDLNEEGVDIDLQSFYCEINEAGTVIINAEDVQLDHVFCNACGKSLDEIEECAVLSSRGSAERYDKAWAAAGKLIEACKDGYLSGSEMEDLAREVWEYANDVSEPEWKVNL